MKSPKLVRRLLLAVAILALLTTIGLFIGYRQVTQDPEALLDLVHKDADMQLDKIRQTASKNGIQEWRLEAESAVLKGKAMRLTRPEVEFFMQDGDNVHLTAEQGVIYTDSSRMQISGRVAARTSRYRFNTQALFYDPEAKRLQADTPVQLSGQAFALQAASMAMDLRTNITYFEGGVEGTFFEDFQL
jgi:LPS export ABC transporter protein LptC